MLYTPDEVETAIGFLKHKAIKGAALLTPYMELWDHLQWPSPDVVMSGDPGFANRFMEAILKECVNQGLPPLASLVVRSDDHYPGAGYFKANGVADPRTATGAARDKALMQWSQDHVKVEQWGRVQRRKARRAA